MLRGERIRVSLGLERTMYSRYNSYWLYVFMHYAQPASYVTWDPLVTCIYSQLSEASPVGRRHHQ